MVAGWFPTPLNNISDNTKGIGIGFSTHNLSFRWFVTCGCPSVYVAAVHTSKKCEALCQREPGAPGAVLFAPWVQPLEAPQTPLSSPCPFSVQPASLQFAMPNAFPTFCPATCADACHIVHDVQSHRKGGLDVSQELQRHVPLGVLLLRKAVEP